MTFMRRLNSRQQRYRLLAGFICLWLIAGVTAAALHVHISPGPSAERHCPACVAMHGAAPSAMVTTVQVAMSRATPSINLPAIIHRSAESSSNLFVRPPPIP